MSHEFEIIRIHLNVRESTAAIEAEVSDGKTIASMRQANIKVSADAIDLLKGEILAHVNEKLAEVADVAPAKVSEAMNRIAALKLQEADVAASLEEKRAKAEALDATIAEKQAHASALEARVRG